MRVREALGVIMLLGAASARAQVSNVRLLGCNATVNLRERNADGSEQVLGLDTKNGTKSGKETVASASGMGTTWEQTGRASQTVSVTPKGIKAISSVTLGQVFWKGKNAGLGLASARGSLEFTIVRSGSYRVTLTADQSHTGTPAGGLLPALDSYVTLSPAGNPDAEPLYQLHLNEAGKQKKATTLTLQPGTYRILFGAAISREWTDLASAERKTPYSGQIESGVSVESAS